MPRTSSITIQGRPSWAATSYTVTTPGWDTRAAAHASRSSRVYIRSTSEEGSPDGARTSFTATSRRSTSSMARHTVPMPPSPSGESRRYRPAITRSPPGFSDTCVPPSHPRRGSLLD